MALIYKNAEKVAAQQARPGVRREADRIHNLAEATLENHRESGQTHVTVEHGKVDSFVVLEDRDLGAALSIEYGQPARGIPGLMILRGAAGLG